MKRYCKTFSYVWIILVVLCLVASSQLYAQQTQWPQPWRCPACTHRQDNPGVCEQCGTTLEEKPGWITTTWDQGWANVWTYNAKCPLDPSDPKRQRRCVVGCIATAAAQIINYWQYPRSVSFDSNDRYMAWNLIYTTIYPIWIDDYSNSLDFPSFDKLNFAMSGIEYMGDPNEEAYLSFAAGIKHELFYSSKGSGGHLSADAYRSGFNYGSAVCDRGFLGLGLGLNWSDHEAKVIENIKKGWPVQIAINGSILHSVIVDGYKSTGEFHINLGAGSGSGDGWYFLPVIDTGTHHWDVVYEIVYDICPTFSGQYGADPCNTRRTPYRGPEDHSVKWIVNTAVLDSRTQLQTAIVGSGGNMYAFCEAKDALDPGRLFVITPHGTVLRSIPIPDRAAHISEPAQASSHGAPIYVAFHKKVYKISLDGNVELFYEDTHLTNFSYPTKVDSDGNVYATGPWKLCSLDSGGQFRWAKSFVPGGDMEFKAAIAIDDERGQVYAKYYDNANDTAHLWALNKDTGVEGWDMPVPAVYSPMAAAGEPTVNDDGTIFARFFKSLRAYNPDGSFKWEYNVNASQEWLEPYISVGPSGNIYVCGSNFGSKPKYAWIRSIRVTDKQLLWEFTKQYPSETSYYTFGAPIVAYGNNMVYSVLHELKSPGYRKLYALRETAEDTIAPIWEHDGADCILLGSTGAAYLLNRESQQIIALSGGEVGDPEGAAMGFINNSAPNLPSNPTPSNGQEGIDYADPVMLSWDCSDPEGHDLKYDFYIGTGEALGLHSSGLTETNCTITGLRPGTGYMWKVVATDGQAVTEGPMWVFATKTQPLVGDFCGEGSDQPDGYVDYWDLLYFAQRWHSSPSDNNWDSRCDLDKEDNYVDYWDLLVFAQQWHKGQKP